MQAGRRGAKEVKKGTGSGSGVSFASALEPASGFFEQAYGQDLLGYAAGRLLLDEPDDQRDARSEEL
jgi:hypothetical protein